MTVLLYFALGILADEMVTGYTLSASHGRALSASLLSFLITILNLYILGRILIFDPSWVNVLAYAVGNAVGCFAIMRVGGRA